MHRVPALPLLLASLLAINFPAFAADPIAQRVLIDPAAMAAQTTTAAQIMINPRTLATVIDTATLSRLAQGSRLAVSIADLGRFDFIVDYAVQDAGLLAIGGHAAGNPQQKITLGLRGDGLTGLIETPQNTYALGYANRVQLAGMASSQWMNEALASERSGMQLRAPLADEQLPAPGAEPVAIDFGVLATMRPGDDVVMQLAGLGATRVRFEEVRPGDGSATWVGHLKDYGDNYKVLLTYSPDSTEGFILTPKGEINLLRTASGGLYQFNPAAAGFKNLTADGESCAVMELAPAPMEPVAAAVAATSGAAASTASSATADTAGQQTIDLLVYYTPGMLAAHGSADKLATRVDALLAAANQAYLAGGLGYRVRRVGLEMVNLDDKTSNDGALALMRNRSGAFANLLTRRNQTGADLVTLIRPFYAQAQGSCGVGYVAGYRGSSVSQYADLGLSVVSDGNDRAGLRYYCDPLSMTHELGHNMGLMHDRATAAGQGGGVGVAPYAYGYAMPGRWGTIMSYTSPRQIKFSNPDDYSCGNQERCGIPETQANSANNVKALALSMPLVAGFRPASGAARSYSVTGVITLNGKPAAGVLLKVSALAASSGAANAASVVCQPSGSTGVFACSAPAGYSFTLTPSYPLPPAGTAVSWTPAEKTITAIAANQTANFAGTLSGTAQSYAVGGVVSIDGQPAGGIGFKVIAPAGSDSTQVACGTSSANGQYSCRVPADYSFTLSPISPSGSKLSWSPEMVNIGKLSSDRVQNFTGQTTVETTHTLSITITVNGQKTLGVPFWIQLGAGNDPALLKCYIGTGTRIDCRMPTGYSATVTMPTTATVFGKRLVFKPASASVSNIGGNRIMSFAGSPI